MGTIRAFSEVQSALGFVILTPLPDTGSVGDLLVNAATQSFVFQYFPESLSDSQPVNYQKIEIPGASHPLYQWINGGARTISFRATFTSERINPLPVADVTNRYNVDINSAILFLRTFRLPTYDKTALLRARPPQRLAMIASGTALASFPFIPITVVLTDMKVDYKAWHSAGIPRHAEVDLTFEEVVQSAFSGINYADRNDAGYIAAKVAYAAPLQATRRAFSS